MRKGQRKPTKIEGTFLRPSLHVYFGRSCVFPLYKESPLWFKETLTAVISFFDQPGGIRRKFDNLHPRQLSIFRPIA